MNKENTTVETVDVDDLDAILNVGSSVMLPAEDEKPSIFSRKQEDISFLNKPMVNDPEVEEEDNEEEEEEGKSVGIKAPIKPKAEVSSDELNKLLEESPEDGDDKDKKTNKDNLVKLTNKLIESKFLVPFDDDKPLADYSLEDFEELITANFADREVKSQAKIAEDFFTSLPQEFKIAQDYISKGGTDLKGLFKSFAQVEEVRQMDPTNDSDAKSIVRTYLEATNFGDADDIEEEITAWEDRGELEAKAGKFKPKLDKLTEQHVIQKLAKQDAMQKRQQEQSKLYMDNVYKTLEPGELNGVKLDRKMQNFLFSGLTQANYPSVSGKPTSLLGHLLEKHQYVEPNHGLIAETLWLLSDPEGYKNEVKKIVKKEVTADTVRKLKTEQANKIASHVQEEEAPKAKTYKIPKPSGNFFKR